VSTQRILAGFPFPAFATERAGQQNIVVSVFLVGSEKVNADVISLEETASSILSDTVGRNEFNIIKYNARIVAGLPFPAMMIESGVIGRQAIISGPSFINEIPILTTKSDIVGSLTFSDNIQFDIVPRVEPDVTSRRDDLGNVEIASADRVDSITPIEEGASSRSDIIPALESSSLSKADILSIQEIASSARNDILTRLEVSSSDRVDIFSQNEGGTSSKNDVVSASELSTSSKVDILSTQENASSEKSDILPKLEYASSLFMDVIVPSEFNIILNTVQEHNLIEFGSSLNSDAIPPKEFSASNRLDIISPIQSQAQLNSDTIGLIALQGLLVTADTMAFVEWLTAKYSARINAAFPFPSFVVETQQRQAITSGPVFVNENPILTVIGNILTNFDWLSNVKIAADTLAFAEWLIAKYSARINAAFPFPSFVVETQQRQAITSGPVFIVENPIISIMGNILSSMDWLSILNSDINGVNEVALTTHTDLIPSQEWGMSAKSDVLPKLEYASSLFMDVIVPQEFHIILNTVQEHNLIEFGATFRADTASVQDWAYILQNVQPKQQIEFAGSAKSDNVSLPCWQATLNTDQLVPTEFLGSSVATFTPRNPLEFGTGMRATSRQQTEFGMGARSDSSAPSERAASSKIDLVGSLESAARIYSNPHVAFDYLTNEQAGIHIFDDFGMTTKADIASVSERGMSAQHDDIGTVEESGTSFNNSRIPSDHLSAPLALTHVLIEAATGARFTAHQNIDFGMTARADNLGFVDFGYGIYGRAYSQMEISASSKLDISGPSEWRTSLNADNISPLEFHNSSFLSTTYAPIEFGVLSQATSRVQTEFSTSVRADLNTALYNLASSQADQSTFFEMQTAIASSIHVMANWLAIMHTIQEKFQIEYGTNVTSNAISIIEGLASSFAQIESGIATLTDVSMTEELDSDWIGDLQTSISDLVEFNTSLQSEIEAFFDAGMVSTQDFEGDPEISVSSEGVNLVEITYLANLFRAETIFNENSTETRATHTHQIEFAMSAEAFLIGRIDWVGICSAIWPNPVNFSANTLATLPVREESGTKAESAVEPLEEIGARIDGSMESQISRTATTLHTENVATNWLTTLNSDIQIAMSAAVSATALITSYAEVIIHASVIFNGEFPLEINTSAQMVPLPEIDVVASLSATTSNVPVSEASGVTTDFEAFTAFESSVEITYFTYLEFSGVFFVTTAVGRTWHHQTALRMFGDGINTLRSFAEYQIVRESQDAMAVRSFAAEMAPRFFATAMAA
jgi:hypothetical protein